MPQTSREAALLHTGGGEITSISQGDEIQVMPGAAGSSGAIMDLECGISCLIFNLDAANPHVNTTSFPVYLESRHPRPTSTVLEFDMFSIP